MVTKLVFFGQDLYKVTLVVVFPELKLSQIPQVILVMEISVVNILKAKLSNNSPATERPQLIIR